jgi:hypothetical protein
MLSVWEMKADLPGATSIQGRPTVFDGRVCIVPAKRKSPLEKILAA